jgi:hypothetical protein
VSYMLHSSHPKARIIKIYVNFSSRMLSFYSFPGTRTWTVILYVQYKFKPTIYKILKTSTTTGRKSTFVPSKDQMTH